MSLKKNNRLEIFVDSEKCYKPKESNKKVHVKYAVLFQKGTFGAIVKEEKEHGAEK